jgi:hypothetical protein
LTYMGVYILTSSIFKDEKHEREHSSHALSACVMTAFLLHCAFRTFPTYKRQTNHYVIPSLSTLLLSIGHCWNYSVIFHFSFFYKEDCFQIRAYLTRRTVIQEPLSTCYWIHDK